MMYSDDYTTAKPFTVWHEGWADYGYIEERFICSSRADVRAFSNWRFTLNTIAEYQGGP